MKRGLSETCYGFFSCLANPTRLATLEKLAEGAMNVSQISKELNQEQSMISHNLRPLLRCGFIRMKKKVKKVCIISTQRPSNLS